MSQINSPPGKIFPWWSGHWFREDPADPIVQTPGYNGLPRVARHWDTPGWCLESKLNNGGRNKLKRTQINFDENNILWILWHHYQC